MIIGVYIKKKKEKNKNETKKKNRRNDERKIKIVNTFKSKIRVALEQCCSPIVAKSVMKFSWQRYPQAILRAMGSNRNESKLGFLRF